MRLSRFLLGGMLLHSTLVLSQEKTDSIATAEDKKRIAVYPAFGYGPETGWSFGAIGFFVFGKRNYEQGQYQPSSLTPFIVYTTNKQLLLKSELDLFTKNGYRLNTNFRYYNFPNKYFGIGNETDSDQYESYTDNFFRLEGRLMKQWKPNFFLGLKYDLQYNSIDEYPDGGLLDSQSPNGIQGGRAIGFGPVFRYDTRNSTLYPTGGKNIGLSMTTYSKVFGSEYDYVLYILDYRQYFEVFGPKSVLAYQYRATLTTGGDVPFYKLNTIAGDNRLRGFDHSNVFRDQQGMYLQVEARQELFWRFGGVLFAGVGEIFENFSDFNSENLRFVYGIGGRFQALKDEKMNVRIDLGFSDDGQSGFFLSVREAF